MDSFDILLVDDTAADASIFQLALDEAHSRAKVYWVASGREALDFLRNQGRFRDLGSPKLVVLDGNLPAENGYSILQSIRSDAYLSRIPVVMLSTSGAQHDVDLAYSLGANSYFRKPRTLEAYVELVRALALYWLDLVKLPSEAADRRSSTPFPERSDHQRS